MLLESEQKSLAYFDLSFSEIACGRKQGKNPSLTKKVVC